MLLKDKITTLQDEHRVQWFKTRYTVENELSEKQLIQCVCGRLATGLHETRCIKFKKKVDRETVKRLNHLIKKQK